MPDKVSRPRVTQRDEVYDATQRQATRERLQEARERQVAQQSRSKGTGRG